MVGTNLCIVHVHRPSSRIFSRQFTKSYPKVAIFSIIIPHLSCKSYLWFAYQRPSCPPLPVTNAYLIPSTNRVVVSGVCACYICMVSQSINRKPNQQYSIERTMRSERKPDQLTYIWYFGCGGKMAGGKKREKCRFLLDYHMSCFN